MSRTDAIALAERYFDSGQFKADLSRRVAMPTESQNPERAPLLQGYLEDEMRPTLERLGFSCRLLTHQKAKAPFLQAERMEDPSLVTVLGYGHGDVIRGLDERWKDGRSPWRMTEEGERWYGRGVADNKGQHAINLAAMEAVLQTRGRLGFNARYLIEMGEEMGSPGLRELCGDNRELFRADLLIASDGPRLAADRPTIFLGSRGGVTFDLWIDARPGAHHSGNWGGILSDPAIQLSHALATITSPTGQIRIPEWVPPELPAAVRRVLAGCHVDGGPDGPEIDPRWGEPGLSPAEQVFGWCSFDVLAMEAGVPQTPVNAVPGRAWARCQLRFVVGVDPQGVLPNLRRHLDRHGFPFVEMRLSRDEIFNATRLDPDDPWVTWAARSLARTTGVETTILPNLGGSLPNDIFAELLGLRTVWVPHSYPGCSQHAPDEHLPKAIAREGLAMMAGLYWDLGSGGTPPM